MSYTNRDVFLSKNEQENIRKMLGPVKTVSEYLGIAAKYLKEGKGLAKSLSESAPWLKDVAEAAGAATPIVGVAVKLAEKWLEQTHPYELGAVACTLAYQDAAREAVEQVWTSALGYQDAMKIDDRVAERIRSLPPAEEADLSSFSRDTALQHAFVKRADDVLGELRLRLSSSLIDALNEAVELTDEDRLAELPVARPRDLLLGGEILRTPYGGDHSLCRYVLILDVWDELDLSDSEDTAA